MFGNHGAMTVEEDVGRRLRQCKLFKDSIVSLDLIPGGLIKQGASCASLVSGALEGHASRIEFDRRLGPPARAC
jgi:hypothetical protein